MSKQYRVLSFFTLWAAILWSGAIDTVQAQTPWQWRNLTPSNGAAPEARRNGAAIYDPVGKRLIIFGGVGVNGLLNDTWAFDLASRTWTKLTVQGTPPAPRLGFDAIYDPTGHQMVIYAGQGAGFFNDTWSLDLNTLAWRDLSPPAATRPKARYGSGSVFDPVSRSLVQFAGFTEESRRFQDTQSFSLANNTWQDWTPAGAKPEIRCLLTAAFDRTNRRMIIYGGQRSGFLDDVWSFDLAARTWTSLTPSQRPPGRWFAASFVDRAGRFNVFGGVTSNGNVNDVWSFDLSARQWTKLSITNPPSERNGSLAAYLEVEDRLLVFGGNGNSGLLNDVWELRRAETLTAVSAASFVGNNVAPDSIVAAFGKNLGTNTQAATTTPLPTALADLRLRLKDSAGAERDAPLFFVSPIQINFLVPNNAAAGLATLTLADAGGTVASSTLNISNIAPSLFSADASGKGLAAAVVLRVRANGAQTTEAIARWEATQNRFVAVPIDLSAENEQVYLILFGTGFRYHSGLSNVRVQLGGVETSVLYAGAQGDFAGLDQLNIALPRTLAGRGEIQIALTVDGQLANNLQLQIK